ncbi:hypothetical protein [Spirochaeta dissipatitropha]
MKSTRLPASGFLFILGLIIAAAAPATADEAGLQFRQSITFDAATTLEAQLSYMAAWRLPLGGTGLLTSGNNIDMRLNTVLNPVSVSGGARVIITPLAILELETSASIGSGWYLAPLDVNGLGVLQDPANNSYSTGAFDGYVLKTHGGAAFQFDTGAVIPGDWSSILLRSYHGAHYQQYSKASNLPWEYMASKNQLNGLRYHADHFIGYQLHAVPILQIVGVLLSQRTAITDRDSSTAASGGWGSDIWNVELGGLAAFTPAQGHSLAVLVQWERSANWSDADRERGLFDRSLNPSDPVRWAFWRAALSYTLSL